MRWNKKRKPLKNKVIAVDFDGTIVRDKFPEIGEPNIELIEWLKECVKNGCKLILWTCRGNNIVINKVGCLDIAVDFCKNLGLYFNSVNENLPEIKLEWNNDTRKVFADIYIDDKAMEYK